MATCSWPAITVYPICTSRNIIRLTSRREVSFFFFFFPPLKGKFWEFCEFCASSANSRWDFQEPGWWVKAASQQHWWAALAFTMVELSGQSGELPRETNLEWADRETSVCLCSCLYCKGAPSCIAALLTQDILKIPFKFQTLKTRVSNGS